MALKQVSSAQCRWRVRGNKATLSRQAIVWAGALCLVGTISIGTALAQTVTWDPGVINNDWDTTTSNWDNGGPTTFANGNNVIFGPTGVGTITITESVDPGTITFNANGYTINSSGVPTLTNPGTITVTNAAHTATISANIISSTGTIAINGPGTLLLSGINEANGAFGGFLISNGTTTVAGGELEANIGQILVTGASTTLNNSGVLDGNVVVQSGGTIKMQNGSTIDGTFTNQASGIANVSGTAGTTFTFANSGTTTVSAGANLTALGGFSNSGMFTNNSTMSGSMNLTGGTFDNRRTMNGTISMSSGANLNNSSTGFIIGDITTAPGAFGTITNSGTFRGTGPLTVQSGQTFNNSGTVSGSVWNGGVTVLQDGATQSGGALFNNQGTVRVNGAAQTVSFVNPALLDMADGDTGDKLTVNGNLNLQSGGTLQVDVHPVAGTADLIQVNGAASVAGTIDVNLLSNGVAASVPIITATGGVTDSGATLGTVTGVINPTFTASLVSPDANTLSVSLAINAVAGNFNGNQTALVENINAGGSSDALTILLGLPSAGATADALDQFSPEIYQDTQTSQVLAASQTLDALFSCDVIGAGDYAIQQQRSCIWARPHGRYSDSDQTGRRIGFEERAYGGFAGAQLALGDHVFIGAAAGYEQASIENNANASSDSERFQAGASLKLINGPVYLGGAVAGGLGEFDTTRNHLVGSNSGEGDEYYYAARVRAAAAFEVSRYYLKPSVDFEATRLHVSGFTETGTASTALAVSDFDDTFLEVTPAIELGAEWGSEGQVAIRTYGGVGGGFRLEGESALSASFVGAAAGVGDFQIATQREDFVLDLVAGIKASVLGVEYRGQVGEETRTHNVFLKGLIPF